MFHHYTLILLTCKRDPRGPVSSHEPLRNLGGLQHLHLGGHSFTNTALIAAMTEHERLALWKTGLSDIAFVTNLPRLKSLHLGGNNISDVSPLAGLNDLEELRLWGQALGDVAPLTSPTGLTLLDLGGTGITDLGFLGAFTSLEQLWLWGNGISDISPLAELTNLRFFDIPDNNISDISILVANPGLGAGDEVNPMNNVLDLTPGSAARNSIQALLDRGVNVAFKPQRSP